MPEFIRKSVPSGGAVKGRISGTPDFGITEALQNYYSTPALTGAGFGRAMQNIQTFLGGNPYEPFAQNLPARLPGMTGDRRPFSVAPASQQPPGRPPGPTPIVLGTRDGVTPDWSQSDQYKAELAQYANTVAGPSKEALGMQIWAQANPVLAAQVQPGQAGYDVIQKQGIRQPGQPEGVVSMPWSMQKPVLGATNAWNPEQQQPAQVAQPEMGEDRTGSTNERVQAFLNMLTGVGQGR